MATHTFAFLCALGVFAVLQVITEGTAAFYSDPVEIVKKHNNLRKNVQPTASNMLEMSWSSEAAVNAQKWADTCAMDHSPDSARVISTSGCGENLYMSSFENSWSNAIQSWYDEIKDWRYGVGSTNGGVVGHFTQVVWYRSNKVGCGVAHCPNSKYKYFYVCQYCPPGNTQLARPYQSGPSCGDCSNACDHRLCTNPCPYSNQYSNCADLKKQWTCSNSQVASWCQASCKCTNEII
ncbi:cysteine-rich venom protein TEL1-like [Centropristis striata]|uniref:cysteine-rich venom protein TEL1-like n=1 Tax=Centropristis striata TaxID=184440 RepID=UPI0027E17C7D|nr:cysteine-rich venom protein TEL1-like [Centropristis striata]